MLTVTGYDKSHRLRHNTPARFTFKALNDSAIAARIAAENLLIPVIDPAIRPPRDSVQQTGSDWAFLQELADRNGFQVYVQWDKLYFRAPRPQTEMTVLEWGKNLSSFNPRLSTSGQFGLQIIRGYNKKLAQEIVAVLPTMDLGADLDHLVERLGSSFLDQLASLGRNVIRGETVENPLDAAILAKTMLTQMLQGLYEGSGNCIGLPTLRAGEMIEIRGLGKRFSGKYTLSKVTHTIGDGGYHTQFEVTQHYNTSLLQSMRQKVVEAPAPNKQKRIEGVVIGKVEKNIDPEGLGRVQLSFPHLSDVNLSAWARVATLMAGGNPENSWGTYFLPDIGAEVLVVFDQGDINSPIVIGSFWNGKAKPPENNTKGGNRIRLIKTPAGHTLTFDDTADAEKITIQDKAGSLITLRSDGTVSIEAAKNLEFKAKGEKISVTLNEQNYIELTTNGVKIKGSLIELN